MSHPVHNLKAEYKNMAILYLGEDYIRNLKMELVKHATLSELTKLKLL